MLVNVWKETMLIMETLKKDKVIMKKNISQNKKELKFYINKYKLEIKYYEKLEKFKLSLFYKDLLIDYTDFEYQYKLIEKIRKYENIFD